MKGNALLRMRYSTRWLAIKLMEMDTEVDAIVRGLPDYGHIIEARDNAVRRIKEETGEDSETAIMDAKYGFIRGALHEAGYVVGAVVPCMRPAMLLAQKKILIKQPISLMH